MHLTYFTQKTIGFFKHASFGLGIFLGGSQLALANNDSNTVVRFVVPFPAGGPTDFIARLFAEPLGKELGQKIVIENKPGASGNIGTKYVADSKPDGLTLVHTTAAMQAVNPIVYPDAGFNPNEDLIPVGITGALPNVLVVHPKDKIETFEQLVQKGKEQGQSLSYATFGPGSSPDFYGSLFTKATDISAVPIAYKGSGQAITDMLGGRIDFMFDSMTTSVPHIKDNKLVGLAITASERSPLLPTIPTLKELGYDEVDMTFWFVVQVPKGTDPETVKKLRAAMFAAAQDPEYLASVKARGVVPLHVKPEELESFVQEQTKKWTDAAKSIGIKPNS